MLHVHYCSNTCILCSYIALAAAKWSDIRVIGGSTIAVGQSIYKYVKYVMC